MNEKLFLGMDSHRSPEDKNSPGTPARFGSSGVLGSFYDQFVDSSVNSERHSHNLPNSMYNSPSEETLPLGGYDIPWQNYLDPFEFPVENISTSEQLTPQQLAELDEYLNSLSQQNASTAPPFQPSEPYASSDPGSDEFCTSLASTSPEACAPNFVNTANQWTGGVDLSENVSYFNSGYNPFGVPKTVFPAEQKVNTCAINTPVPVSPPENTASKPSFAEVAKNNSTATGKDSERRTTFSPKNLLTADGKHDGKVLFNPPQRNSQNNLSKAAYVNKIKKAKSSKSGNLQRSKSVPVEPAEIKPNSRYGLDTFDDKNVEKDPKSVVSCGNSRKNSTSSMSSGMSLLEEIQVNGKQPSEVYQSSECGHFGANLCDKEQPKKRGSFYDAKPKAKSSSSSEEVYFDPRRIFQDSREKNSKCVQTNNEDYVPNNKQKIQPDKDCLLNKEKNKASVKSGSTKYINNDLRDTKKHTNIDQDRDHNVIGQSTKDARGRSQVNVQGKNKAKSSKADSFSHSKSGSKGNSHNEKIEKVKQILGKMIIYCSM